MRLVFLSLHTLCLTKKQAVQSLVMFSEWLFIQEQLTLSFVPRGIQRKAFNFVLHPKWYIPLVPLYIRHRRNQIIIYCKRLSLTLEFLDFSITMTKGCKQLNSNLLCLAIRRIAQNVNHTQYLDLFDVHKLDVGNEWCGFMQTNLHFIYISFTLCLRICTDICLLRLSDSKKSIRMSFSVKVNFL